MAVAPQPTPEVPRGACGKFTYPTKRMANAVKNQTARSKRRRGKVRKMRSYFCDRCGGWHLTGMPIEAWKRLKDED